MIKSFILIVALSSPLLTNANTINKCVDQKGKVTLTESDCAKLGLRNESSHYYTPSTAEDITKAEQSRRKTLEQKQVLEQWQTERPKQTVTTTTTTTTTKTGTILPQPSTAANTKKTECMAIDAKLASIAAQQRNFSTPYLTERRRELQDLRYKKRCHVNE